MKNILLLLLMSTPLFTSAQKTFKFVVVNADTGQPMVKKWITVLQNNNEAINFAPTDNKGVYTFTVRDYDSTAIFRAQVTNHWGNYVEPGYFDVTAVKTSIPVIKIKSLNFAVPNICGTTYYGNYHAFEPMFLQELPSLIKVKIKKYLIKRVGETLYKKMIFNGGQVVDLKTFYSRNPDVKKKEYLPLAYDLCFMVWDSVAHESLYDFRLQMDERGRLRKPIPLPDIVHYPAKAHILTLKQAKTIAKTQGFDVPYVQTKLYYYAKAKSIVWEFEYYDDGEGDVQAYQLLIDAHSGKIVNRKTYQTIINH